MSQIITYQVEEISTRTVTIEVKVSEADLDTLTHAELDRRVVDRAWGPIQRSAPTFRHRVSIVGRKQVDE